MKLDGKVVVLTGAGSGIGQELALALLRRGARVAGIDLRPDGLAETARLANAGERLTLHEANVADRDAVLALPAAIEAAHGTVDVLINNAGIIQPFVDFNTLDFDVIDRLVNVNLMGPINMTKAFLPILLTRPEAHLANTASMGGFIPFPGQTLYSATKAGVKLLSEGIYSELMNTKVGVSVIMPGAVGTKIMENSGVNMNAGVEASGAKMTSAPDAARIILDGIEAGKLHILVGSDARMLWRLVRLAPAWSIGFIQKQMAKMVK